MILYIVMYNGAPKALRHSFEDAADFARLLMKENPGPWKTSSFSSWSYQGDPYFQYIYITDLPVPD